MSQQNKTTLQSNINTQIADNSLGDITAADVRDNLINMTDSLLFNSGSQGITGSLTATSFTGSLFGTASFYNETDTLQSVVTRGSFASSSTNIILSANDTVQIRGQVGNSNATASLAFGVGTNTNNYILATKTLNIQGNRNNNNNLGVTILSAEDSNRAARITVGSGSNASRIQLATTLYQGTGPVTNLEIEDQQTFIYGPLIIGDDDPNGIYGSLEVTGSLSVTGSIVSLKGLPTSEPSTSGQLWLSGSAGSNSKVLCVRN